MSQRGSDPRTDSSDKPATGPLLLWLIPQVAALVVATLRINLWARYPQPGELMSLRILLSVQFCLASLLFPMLLRDSVSAIAVMASSWPLALVAGSLSATPIRTTFESELCVTCFLLALTCWLPILTRANLARAAVAIISLCTIGGPLLVYLRLEFNDAAPPLNTWIAGPLFAVQRLLSGDPVFLAANAFALAIAVMGLGLGFLLRRRLASKATFI